MKIIILALFLFLNIGIIESKNTSRSDNNPKETNLRVDLQVKDISFMIICSQKYWRFSTVDSTYIDYLNIKKDTSIIEGEMLIQSIPKSIKIVLSNEEKLKIIMAAKSNNFNLLSDNLHLNGIQYINNEFKQTITINSRDLNHSVTWDGIIPDIGNNEYVVKHRKLVNQFNELSSIIYSILKNKVEINNLYNQNKMNCPIYINGVSLKKIGFPQNKSSLIGNYLWGVTVLD